MYRWSGPTIAMAVACSGLPPEDQPRSGEWAFGNAQIVVNECQFPESDLVLDGKLYLRVDNDEMFTVALPDAIDPIPCDKLDGAYSCIDDQVSQVSGQGVTITLGTELIAMFVDDQTGQITQQLEGNCTGSVCDVLGTSFPCRVDLQYDVIWLSDDLGVLATAM